jgi:hypothetical protein
MSAWSHCSAIRPPARRVMAMPPIVTRLPVGAMSANGPVWVPRSVKRVATRSASARQSSTVTVRSGKAVRNMWVTSRIPAIPGDRPGWAVWST